MEILTSPFSVWTAEFIFSALMSQFQNSSKLSKRPRFDLRKGAFSPVALQAAGSNYPLQLFANGIFAIFRMTFEITSLNCNNITPELLLYKKKIDFFTDFRLRTGAFCRYLCPPGCHSRILFMSSLATENKNKW